MLMLYVYTSNNGSVCMANALCSVICDCVYIASPIMQCSYVIDVAVHVPWAPDIEVRQPLLIKPPPNVIVSQSSWLNYQSPKTFTLLFVLHVQWGSWHPPSWVADCRQAPVTGSCAVPPDVLSKSHDNHMTLSCHYSHFYYCTASQSFVGIPGFQPVL